MPTILVVDDSPVDRRLAGGLLPKDTGWEILYAADGAEAMAVLDQSPADVVVTGLVMPKMDGFQLVAAVRSKYPRVPVILMTSLGSEEIAVQALRLGAASYVPKRLLAERLRETVQQVLAVSSRQRRHRELLRCMTRNHCSFVLGNDCSLLDPLVLYLQEIACQLGVCDESDGTRIGVALEEALVNALYHGNLGIGSELQGEHAAYCELISRRCREPPYADRRICVDATLTRQDAVFVIRDEGAGFDPSKLPDPNDPANLERTCGRGILLMRAFMDEVIFNDAGNAVTLVKRCKGRGARGKGQGTRGERRGVSDEGTRP